MNTKVSRSTIVQAFSAAVFSEAFFVLSYDPITWQLPTFGSECVKITVA